MIKFKSVDSKYIINPEFDLVFAGSIRQPFVKTVFACRILDSRGVLKETLSSDFLNRTETDRLINSRISKKQKKYLTRTKS